MLRRTSAFVRPLLLIAFATLALATAFAGAPASTPVVGPAVAQADCTYNEADPNSSTCWQCVSARTPGSARITFQYCNDFWDWYFDNVINKPPDSAPTQAPTITAGPEPQSAEPASLSFSSGEAKISGYQCRLEEATAGLKHDWEACSSPKAYPDLDPGDYTFQVRATNAKGTGPAASRSWSQADVCPLPDAGNGRAAGDVVEPPKVGNWWFTGCFRETETPGVLEAKREVELNGLKVKTNVSTDKLLVNTNTKTLTSSGPVTVTADLKLAGVALGSVTLLKNATGQTLSFPLGTTPSTGKAAAGLTLLGWLGRPGDDVTFKALLASEVQVTVPLKLAGVLGGTNASGTFTVTPGGSLKSLDSLNVSATEGDLGEMIKVKDLSFSYTAASGNDPATWTATGGLDLGGVLSGGLTVKDQKLDGGTLKVSKAPIGGLFTLQDLELASTAGAEGARTWSGGGKVDGRGVTFAMTHDKDGKLTSAAFHGDRLDFWDVIGVGPVDFVYDHKTGWSANAKAQLGGGSGPAADFSVAFKDGKMTSGHFEVSAVDLFGVTKLEALKLDYSYDAETKDETWSGEASLIVSAGSTTGSVGAQVAMVNGVFNLLRVDVGVPTAVSPPIPIIPGVVGIQRLQGLYQASPKRIAGRVALAVGPDVGGNPLIAFDGQGTYVFPVKGDEKSDRWDYNGSLTAVGIPVASGGVSVYKKLDKTSWKGKLGGPNGWDLGLVQVDVTLNGSADAKGVFGKGTGLVKVLQIAYAEGTLLVGNRGVAGCGKASAGWTWEAGFSREWATGKLETVGQGCDVGRWQQGGVLAPPEAPGNGRAVEAARTTFFVPAQRDVEVLRFTGDGDVPSVTLTAPDGTTKYVTPTAVGDFGVKSDHVVLRDDDANQLIFMVDTPAAGTWTATVDDGSVPVTAFERANELADPNVAAQVTGSGAQRTLAWTATDVPGQTITFVERTDEGDEVLGTVDGAAGSLAFTPASGPAGQRRIVAEVEQDGLPRESRDVATYTAEGGYLIGVATQGQGKVTGTGIDCGTTCSKLQAPGAALTLTPQPAAGWQLAGWEGACAGVTAACVLPADGPGATKAVFTLLPVTPVTTTAGGDQTGGATTTTAAPVVVPPVVKPPSPPVGPPARVVGPMPKVKASAAKLVRGNALTFSGGCSLACTLSTKGSSLRIGKKTVKLKTVTKRLAKKGTTAMAIKLTAAQRKALRASGGVFELVLTAHYAGDRIGGPEVKKYRLPKR